MNINVKLNRKDTEIESDSCVVEKMIELSGNEFAFFKENLLHDHDFILKNVDLMHQDTNGVYHCLLVLGEGQDDGILVESEGSFYARYSALIPNARQLVRQTKYDPVLTEFCDKVQSTVDKMMRDAVRYNQNGEFRILLDKYTAEFDDEVSCRPIIYETLCHRPEITDLEEYSDMLVVHVSPEYLPQPTELRRISPEQFEIMCAKHLLWLYDESGEQADFSGCDLSDVDLRHKKLNNALFVGARLYSVPMDGAELCFTDFTGADMRNCSLRNITADEIVMKNAVAYTCDFTNAVMMHGNFTGADLTGSTVVGSFMQNSCFDSAQMPKELLLQAYVEHYSMNEQEWDESSGPVLSM